MKTVAERIAHLSPCTEAVAWAKHYTMPAKAWRECVRGDWMLWLLGKLSGAPESDARKKLVLAACDCAALPLPHATSVAAALCLETARKWARGEATIEELREARKVAAAAAAAAFSAAADAAADAAAAAAFSAAADAAAAAFSAAFSAAAAAAAAFSAAFSAAAVADAADAAAFSAVRCEMLQKCADIVRQHYPSPPKIAVNYEG
jgi:hypothetical protein